MAKPNNKLQYILLALGILFFICGVVIFFLPPNGQIAPYHFWLNASFVFLTAACVYISLLMKSYVWFYISLNLCAFSLMMLILMVRAVESPLGIYWPVAIIILGATLFPVGMVRYKKFLTAYVFPSAALVVLGVFFLLFTFKIIKMRMRVFFGYFLPFILVLGGVALIALYYVRQNAKDKFPFINDGDKYDDYDIYIGDDE